MHFVEHGGYVKYEMILRGSFYATETTQKRCRPGKQGSGMADSDADIKTLPDSSMASFRVRTRLSEGILNT